MDNTDKFIRSFWRRIHYYRNKYEKDLPEEMPVEFRAACETAMIWLREDDDFASDPVPTAQDAALPKESGE